VGKNTLAQLDSLKAVELALAIPIAIIRLVRLVVTVGATTPAPRVITNEVTFVPVTTTPTLKYANLVLPEGQPMRAPLDNTKPVPNAQELAQSILKVVKCVLKAARLTAVSSDTILMERCALATTM